MIDEIIIDKDIEKSNTEIEKNENIEGLNFPQEYEDWVINNLDVSNEEQMNDSRVQTSLKRSRHIRFYIFIFSQDYYQLPEKTIRANGKMYHIFKPNSFRDSKNSFNTKQV